jgi:hypothetical protein
MQGSNPQAAALRSDGGASRFASDGLADRVVFFKSPPAEIDFGQAIPVSAEIVDFRHQLVVITANLTVTS